jgi:intracellular sulfur oxidation DsrE/DsrF family protein
LNSGLYKVNWRFRSSDAGGDVSKRTDELSKSGLQMHACGNTMRALNITLKDLLPGRSRTTVSNSPLRKYPVVVEAKIGGRLTANPGQTPRPASAIGPS